MRCRRCFAAACAFGMLPALGCGEDRGGDVDVQTSGTNTARSATATTPSESGAQVPEGVVAQYRTIEEEVREEGGEQTVGPWRIAYIVEPAEGWFEPHGGGLRWRAPRRSETNHIEIVPIEADTGRLVPDVPVTLEVRNAQGERVSRKRLAFSYAEFFHYAENFALPATGDYTLRASIRAPRFRRHGEESGPPPLAEGATVEFRDVEIDTQQ